MCNDRSDTFLVFVLPLVDYFISAVLFYHIFWAFSLKFSLIFVIRPNFIAFPVFIFFISVFLEAENRVIFFIQ